MLGAGAGLGPVGREEPGRAVEEAQDVFKPVFSVPALSMAQRAGWVEWRDPGAMGGSKGRVLAHWSPVSGALSRACAGPKWSSVGSAHFRKHLEAAFFSSEYLSPAVPSTQEKEICVR